MSRAPAAGSGPDLRLDRFLPYRLSALAARTSRLLSAVYRQRFDISIPEWRVLAHVAAHSALSLREVSEVTNLDKATASRAVARLERNGRLEKRVHPGDRRLVELFLTRKGRRLFKRIEPLALAFESLLVEELAPKDVAALHRLIARLDARLDALEGARPKEP